jgi:hypothetical protein
MLQWVMPKYSSVLPGTKLYKNPTGIFSNMA